MKLAYLGFALLWAGSLASALIIGHFFATHIAEAASLVGRFL